MFEFLAEDEVGKTTVSLEKTGYNPFSRMVLWACIVGGILIQPQSQTDSSGRVGLITLNAAGLLGKRTLQVLAGIQCGGMREIECAEQEQRGRQAPVSVCQTAGVKLQVLLEQILHDPAGRGESPAA